MKRFLIYILFVFGISMVLVSDVKAACDPPECGAYPIVNTCTSGQICSAKCCVDPDPGDPGDPGGGGTTGSCPAGTVLTFTGTGPITCTKYAVKWNQRIVGCCVYGGGECVENKLETGYCVPICSATAPTSLSFSQSSQVMSWTSGTGGVSQRLYVSADPNQITNNCTLLTSPGCVVNDTNAVSPYSTTGLLSPGSVYYTKVVNYSSDSCQTSSSTLTFISSCALSSASVNVDLGNTVELGSSVNSSSAIENVSFTSSDPGIATATSPDAVYPYSTTIGGVSLGTATITSDVYIGGSIACTDTAGANVLAPDPWWQVMDGDTSSNGNLVSDVPSGLLFGLAGLGGYPGVAAYGGTTNLVPEKVSDTRWFAQSLNAGQKTFGYQYFSNQAPENPPFNPVNLADAASDLSSGGVADSEGYYWFKYSSTGADLTIDSPVSLGDRKVILFVDSADLYINSPINLTKGQGFFLVVVGKNDSGGKGSIIVNPAVGGTINDLEGLYVADGTFQTGISALQLKVRGSVTGFDGITMQRDLADDSDPAEFYEYAPDQILLFPKSLSVRKINWKEVAP